ncbi:glutenin, high molecular weight subunit DY10 isoform X3 [Drosophila subpulchrella]|uniref:glutenin, high molecular weight subunit DY10 isoform X2 n=1 Tax=Drosophila subpulchrella TaxID=1486046 RepID=UPI0018A13BAD|nr:glutenin, high molecular weight subunit DY10 isoform X2 [Drosophila subpulchrella]XP_037714257.1 glutenin, high molecular weight subunit DY10 isoform X3 [Drosophila subpulchrella]
MFSQLLSVSLALPLIFIVSGQRFEFQNPYYVENGGRGNPHHSRHHGHGHHGHGPGYSGPPPFAYGHFAPRPSYFPDNQPSGGVPPYYPSGGPVWGHQPGGQFGGPPGRDFNRGQPSFQQPGGDYPRGQVQPELQQPGGDPARWQPAGKPPGAQQPGSDEERPTYPGGFQQPGGGNTLQPRPGQNTGGFQQPAVGGNTLKPRPEPNTGGFQQPGQNAGGFQQPGHSTGGFQQPGQNAGGFQQPSGTGNTLQPRPGQNAGGFQQPSDNNPIQPRPGSQEEDYSGFNFQSPNTLQPRPNQGQEIGSPGARKTIQPIPGQQQPSVIQPIPGQDSSPDTVGNNIKDLFSTQDFLSPGLSQAPGANRDPKSEAEEVSPEGVNQRSLFDLDPKCSGGTKLMAGRCRKEA